MKFCVSSISQNSSSTSAESSGVTAAQIRQLFRQPLHIRLRQRAKNLFRAVFSHGHQQNSRFARSTQRV